jgi:hypothetical protein
MFEAKSLEGIGSLGRSIFFRVNFTVLSTVFGGVDLGLVVFYRILRREGRGVLRLYFFAEGSGCVACFFAFHFEVG